MVNKAFSRSIVFALSIIVMALVADPVEAQYSGVYDSAWGQIRLDEQSDGRVIGIYTTGINGLPGTITGELKEKENYEGERYMYVQGTFRDDHCSWWHERARYRHPLDPVESGDLLPSECEGSFEIDFLYYPDDTSEFVAWYRLFGSSEAVKVLWGKRMPFGDEDFDS